MPIPRRATHQAQEFDDVLDALLLELIGDHPRVPLEDEVALKDRLLQILADADPRTHSPSDLMRRFSDAMGR